MTFRLTFSLHEAVRRDIARTEGMDARKKDEYAWTSGEGGSRVSERTDMIR